MFACVVKEPVCQEDGSATVDDFRWKLKQRCWIVGAKTDGEGVGIRLKPITDSHCARIVNTGHVYTEPRASILQLPLAFGINVWS